MADMSKSAANTVLKTALASLGPRGISILTGLIIMPLGIAKLGTSGYAIWILATTVPSLVVSPDLGLGQGVVNRLLKNKNTAGYLNITTLKTIAGLQRVLILVAILWLVIGLAAVTLYVKYINEFSGLEVFKALSIGLICFVIGIPPSIWTRAQLVEHRLHVSLMWETIGRASSLFLCFMVLVIRPDVTLLVVAFLLPPSITAWMNAYFYSMLHPELSETNEIEYKKTPINILKEYKKEVGVGGQFLAMQIMYLFSTSLDPFLIDAKQSKAMVTEWAVSKKPFDLIIVITGLYSVTLWPLISDRIRQGDIKKVNKILSTTVIAAISYSLILSIITIIFSRDIYKVLGAGEIEPNTSSLAFLGAITLVTCVTMILQMFLNAVEATKIQMWVMLLMTLVILAAKLHALNSPGLVLFFKYTAIATFVTYLIPIISLTYLYMRKIALPKGLHNE